LNDLTKQFSYGSHWRHSSSYFQSIRDAHRPAATIDYSQFLSEVKSNASIRHLKGRSSGKRRDGNQFVTYNPETATAP